MTELKILTVKCHRKLFHPIFINASERACKVIHESKFSAFLINLWKDVMKTLELSSKNLQNIGAFHKSQYLIVFFFLKPVK